jgi:site-specific DNA recombinase
MKRCYVYARVSTDRQAESGVSLEDQVARCTARANAEGLDVLDTIVDDGYSASSLDRPGVQRVLDAIRKRTVDAVVIAKLDRLTRSIRDAADLVALCQKQGVALISLAESLDTSSAMGRMMVNFLAMLAEFERDNTAERTRTALAHKRSRGEKLGGKTPYGYAVEVNGETRNGAPIKVLVKCAEEQSVLEQMRALQAGGASLEEIAAAVNHSGRRNRDGREWTRQGVWKVLKNGRMAA